MDAGFGAALGLIAVFCGVTNSPMTSILLGYELFGGQGLALLAMCAAVSYLLSGYSGLYREQKIIYSKTSPVFIGRKGGRRNNKALQGGRPMRNYRMDNIRCIQIFLVVFGHMLTWIPEADTPYRIIYLFHMPAFLFLTGYFSHFNISKILTQLAYPYILFQILYLIYDTLVFRDAPIHEMVLQFSTPTGSSGIYRPFSFIGFSSRCWIRCPVGAGGRSLPVPSRWLC